MTRFYDGIATAPGPGRTGESVGKAARSAPAGVLVTRAPAP